MTEKVVIAIYENGVLRPLTPLKLREQERVRLQILPAEEPPEAVTRALHALATSGLVTPCPGRSDIAPLSAERRQEIAHALAAADSKPLSEIIIEERGKQ